MQKKRFNLPPLDLIQGFEAAARNLSFTKAAEELFITQSAVSRQIRGLEEHLGIALFERRHRALALTEQGPRALQRGHRAAGAPAGASPTGCAPTAAAPHLTVTTTSGFASLWLIPRLRGLHRAATPTSMCASPPATSSWRWSAAWSTWRCAVPGRRTRRRAPSACSARSCSRSAARRCVAEGPHPLRSLGRPGAPRAPAHGRRRRLFRLEHVAGGAGLRGSEARGFAAGSTATSR